MVRAMLLASVAVLAWGGRSNAQIPDPVDPRVLWSASGSVWRSGDRGRSWEMRSRGLEGVRTLAVAPSDSSVLYAGTWFGLYASIDAGVTWRRVSEQRVDQIEVDPRSPQRVFARMDGSVSRSEDGGVTWNGIGLLGVQQIIAHRRDPDRWVAVASGSVLRSVDGGATWEPTRTTAQSVQFDAANPDHFYTLARGWIARTLNGGASTTLVFWHAADAFVVAPGDGDRLYVHGYEGIGSRSQGLWRSDDGGLNWVRLPQGRVTPTSVDPRHRDVVYGVHDHEGAVRSADGGWTWKKMQLRPRVASVEFAVPFSVAPTEPPTFHVGLDRWRAGRSLRPLRFDVPLGVRWVLRNPVEPRTVYVATSGTRNDDDRARYGCAVGRSMDGGRHWRFTPLCGRHSAVVQIAMSPSDGAVVYAASSNQDARDFVHRSVDGARTWQEVGPASLSYVEMLAVDPRAADRVFVSDEDRGLLLTEDAGATWTSPEMPLVDEAGWLRRPRVPNLAFDPVRTDVVYAVTRGIGGGTYATGGDLLRSSDGGRTWHVVAASVAGRFLSVIVDPSDSNRLVAGMVDGVFESVDAGVAWTRVGALLDGRHVNFVAIDPTDGTLYASTADAGVFVWSPGGEWRPG